MRFVKARSFLEKNEFLHSVLVLMSGTGVAQLLLILASPFLTRLYTPEAFGILGFFASFVSIFAVISAGRYELAIPLSSSTEDAMHVVFSAILCVIFSTIGSVFFVIFIFPKVTLVLNISQLTPYGWLLPISIFFMGLYNIFSNWMIRIKSFGSIARTKFSQVFSLLFVQLFGYKVGVLALLVGQVIGQSCGVLGLMYSAIRAFNFKEFSWVKIGYQAKKHYRFPLYSTWDALFNTASIEVTVLAFLFLYGTKEVGFYTLAFRVLGLPMSLVASSVGNVFFSRALEAKEKGTLALLLTSLRAKLVLISAPILVCVFLFGPYLFSVLFGEAWSQAGSYARWIALFIYFQFQWSPLSTLITVLNLQAAFLIAQILLFGFRVSVFVFCFLFHVPSLQTIIAFSVVSACSYFCIIYWFLSRSGVRILEGLKLDLSIVIMTVLFFLPLYLALLFTLKWLWFLSLTFYSVFLLFIYKKKLTFFMEGYRKLIGI